MHENANAKFNDIFKKVEDIYFSIKITVSL